MLSERDVLKLHHRLYGDRPGCYRRTCTACGAQFYTSRPEARYCRPACRQRTYRQRRRSPQAPKLITSRA